MLLGVARTSAVASGVTLATLPVSVAFGYATVAILLAVQPAGHTAANSQR